MERTLLADYSQSVQVALRIIHNMSLRALNGFRAAVLCND